MTSSERKDNSVSYVRSHRSTCPEAVTDQDCQEDAQRFHRYLQDNPDSKISGIRYDSKRKKFIITHRNDGEFLMDIREFYYLVAQRYFQLLSVEVRKKLESLLEL